MLSKDSFDVSAVWAERHIPVWAKALRNATSRRAASALIHDIASRAFDLFDGGAEY
jgi:hypothetical protein